MIQKDSVRIPAWERENFRLNKGNIFPSRKSLVNDIPAGRRENRKTFSYGVCAGVEVSSRRGKLVSTLFTF